MLFSKTNYETEKQLTKEFRALSKIHHPDAGGSTAMFQQLQSEYEQLKLTVGQQAEPLAFDININDIPEDVDQGPTWDQQRTVHGWRAEGRLVDHYFDSMTYNIKVRILQQFHNSTFTLVLHDTRFGMKWERTIPPHLTKIKGLELDGSPNSIYNLEFDVQ